MLIKNIIYLIFINFVSCYRFKIKKEKSLCFDDIFIIQCSDTKTTTSFKNFPTNFIISR